MTYVGSWKIDDLLTFYANTTRVDTGAATDADSAPTYRVYEDETGTAILTGSMALLDSSNTAGFYSEQITLSAANGFEKGKCYAIYIQATVNSIVGATHRTFQIQAEVAVASYNSGQAPLQPTVAGRTLDVSAGGEAGLDWANIGSPTTAQNLSATNIDVDQVVASVSGAVGSVTGAVGSVTGNVGGNVTGSVGSVVGNVGGNVAGSVGSVTGNLGGNVNGNVVGSVGSVAGNVGGNVVGSVGSVAGNVVGDVQGNVDGSIGSLAAQAQTDVSDAVGTRDVDGGTTLDESLRLANSANGGKLSGAATTNVLIRDLADTKDRVDATVDASGNRTAVTLDLT